MMKQSMMRLFAGVIIGVSCASIIIGTADSVLASADVAKANSRFGRTAAPEFGGYADLSRIVHIDDEHDHQVYGLAFYGTVRGWDYFLERTYDSDVRDVSRITFANRKHSFSVNITTARQHDGSLRTTVSGRCNSMKAVKKLLRKWAKK